METDKRLGGSYYCLFKFYVRVSLVLFLLFFFRPNSKIGIYFHTTSDPIFGLILYRLECLVLNYNF